jgi:hypothetical protein
MSTPLILVERFVEKVLNEHEVAALDTYLDLSFVDHEPLYVEGVVMPSGRSTRTDVVILIKFLAQAGVDFRFHLEQAVEAQEDQVKYRLFGHGELDFEQLGIELRESRRPDPGVPYLDGKLTMTYQCSGRFRVADHRFVERWGSQELF